MTTKRKLALTAALLSCASAFAQQWSAAPTPEDLQAAYCFGLAKATMPTNDAGDFASRLPPTERNQYNTHVAQQQSNFKRLQGYLAGRLGVVDTTGLMIASKQAEVDLQASLASMTTCVQACKAAPCNYSTPTHIQAKVDRCRSLDFMPY